MNEWFTVAMAFVAGAALGWFFLQTLWWTVQRLPTSEHPALLVLGSLLLRMSVVVGVLAALAISGDWRLLVAGVAGFVLIRSVGVRYVSQRSRVDVRFPIAAKPETQTGSLGAGSRR